MSTHVEFQGIEPEVLAGLAEKAMQAERRLANPYLRALMARLGRLALEVEAALEKEGRLDSNWAHSSDADKGQESVTHK